MIHEFGLGTLINLDGGRIVEAWNQAISRATRDCEDRPAENKPRKVTLELELTPVVFQDGAVLDSLKGIFRIKDTVPTRQSKDYSLGFRKRHGQARLVFNDLSEDDIHQKTIDE